MKKLVSLALVLSLVLGLATVAFATEAAGTSDDPIVVTDIADLQSINIPAGTVKWFLLPGDWSGMNLEFSAPMCMPAIYTLHPWYGMEQLVAQGFMSASYALEGWGDILIGLGSAFGYEIMGGSCVLTEPVEGSAQKPVVLEDISNPITVNCIETAEGPAYHMTWTNYGEGGNLIVSDVTGNFDVIEVNYNNLYSDMESISVGVSSYEEVSIVVRALDLEPVTFSLSFDPYGPGESEYTAFEIADQDKDYTFEAVLNEGGSEVFYQLTDVSGAILSINSPNAVISGYGNSWCEEIDDGDDNVMTVKVNVWGNEGIAIVGIAGAETDTSFIVNVSEPAGYDENPVVLNDLEYIGAEIAGGLEDHFYYVWTAAEAGTVTLDITGGEWFGDALINAATEYEYIWNEEYEYNESIPVAWADIPAQVTVFVNGEEVAAGDGISFNVKPNDLVILKVQVLPLHDYDDYGYSAYVDVEGSFDSANYTAGNINPRSVTLSLDDLIFMNVYSEYTGGNLSQKYIEVNGGLIYWNIDEFPGDANVSINDANAVVVPGLTYNTTNGRYQGKTEGIALKNLGDNLKLCSYIELPDGTIMYSRVIEYSGVRYAMSRINNIDEMAAPSDANVAERDVCIAMLNAVTEAQKFFKHNVENPANAQLSAERQVVNYSSDLLTAAQPADMLTLDRDNTVFTGRGATLALEGKIEMTFTFTIPAEYMENAMESGVMFWTRSGYEAAYDLSSYTANYTGTLEETATANKYSATYPVAFATKEYEDTVYACAYVVDADWNYHYSGIIAYNVEAYAKSKINNNAAEADLCKALVVYGEAAKACFAK